MNKFTNMVVNDNIRNVSQQVKLAFNKSVGIFLQYLVG